MLEYETNAFYLKYLILYMNDSFFSAKSYEKLGIRGHSFNCINNTYLFKNFHNLTCGNLFFVLANLKGK